MTAKQGTLEPAEETRLVPIAPVDPELAMIERLATNDAVNVDKLKALLDMKERILDRNAKSAFDSAFAEMAAEIPTIAERSKTDKTTYAPLEDIVSTVKPSLHRHGFALSFRTAWPDPKTVKVIGILTHRDGHSRESEFLSAADQTGSKNAIQALGSAVTYGRRYTAKDLLNITTSEQDDDGEKSEDFKKPDAPTGYDDWQIDMEASAGEGWPKLSAAFGKSSEEYRKRATGPDKSWWNGLKSKAEAVTKAGKR